MGRYGLVGHTTRGLLTFNGQVIVHTSREELEWLFPKTRVVRLSDGDIGPTMQLRDHPRFAGQNISWPLKREEFL